MKPDPDLRLHTQDSPRAAARSRILAPAMRIPAVRIPDTTAVRRPFTAARRGVATAVALALGLVAAACSGGGNGGKLADSGGSDLRLTAVHHGRLVDVYGLRGAGSLERIALVERDVLVSSTVQDQRPPGSGLQNDEIEHDFLAVDPETLQPRLLIPRPVGSPDFDRIYADLGRHLRRVAPVDSTDRRPDRPAFSVVPRNGAIQLVFDRPLPFGTEFFHVPDANGAAGIVRNHVAVQLLQIVGDLTDSDHTRDLRPIPCRYIVRGNTLILDPVVLATEARRHDLPPAPEGLPESADSEGANIRLAMPLDGPLALPALRGQHTNPVLGRDLQARQAVVRDFRSGNRSDENDAMARGFVRDETPPRLLGELRMRLAAVDPGPEDTRWLTIYKDGVLHELDLGDALRVHVGRDETALRSELLLEPTDDERRPEVQWVRVLAANAPGLDEADPRRLPDHPGDGDKDKLASWLAERAPLAVVVAEFTARKRVGQDLVPADDARYFVRFAPDPLPEPDGRRGLPNDDVSPFANAVLRFSKPVDFTTVRAHDTLFFATRDVFDPVAVDEFRRTQGISASSWSLNKFLTPHLIAARALDGDGARSTVRISPLLGFYLDEKMREVDEPLDFDKKRFRYHLHLRVGKEGITDFAGRPLDLGELEPSRPGVVLPFAVDTRRGKGGKPLFGDNLVVNVVRRLAEQDEDPQPSWYRKNEASGAGVESYRLPDMVGAVTLENGRMQARGTSRVRRHVDDLNQPEVPTQRRPETNNPAADVFNTCPYTAPAVQNAKRTASIVWSAPIQTPINPYGSRLHTVWREIDLGLGRHDPFDMNLDVEAMFWAPFRAAPIYFDELDKTSVYLGHSEHRPEACRGSSFAGPTMRNSGLQRMFSDNYVHSRDFVRNFIPGPAPHAAYLEKPLVFDPNLAILDPFQINRYMPLPEFKKPYFVFRDETLEVQGGDVKWSSDVDNGLIRFNQGNGIPAYLASPYAGGSGRNVVASSGSFTQYPGRWVTATNYNLTNRRQPDGITEGLVGPPGLPLLMDFWTYPDSADLPSDDPYFAYGVNGWQVSLPYLGFRWPAFRVYSGGQLINGTQRRFVDPSTESFARGSWTTSGQGLPADDNTTYWIAIDFLKARSVATAGFVDVYDPHRMPLGGVGDPRLGPFFMDSSGNVSLPPGITPVFDVHMEPLTQRGGARIDVEFRGAGEVDPDPWLAKEFKLDPKPDATNFPLDPYKAGDAWVRKFDDRPVNSRARNFWTGFYNRNVTGVVGDPNDLFDDEYLSAYRAPGERFTSRELRYVNWRFILTNNVEASPPVAPELDTFVLAYRFQRAN